MLFIIRNLMFSRDLCYYYQHFGIIYKIRHVLFTLKKNTPEIEFTGSSSSIIKIVIIDTDFVG